MKMASIINQCANDFLERYDHHLQPGHRRALDAMLACRQHCGECLIECEHCDNHRWLGLSCGHRSCPQCQVNLGERWFDRQQQKLLPVPYFMVTFTLPKELRTIIWQEQQFAYDILFNAAAKSLKTIGKNNHGMNLGMTGVLHTHTRELEFHPHIHFIVPGGGLVKNEHGTYWQAMQDDYLINEFALAKVFRGIFLRLLAENGIDTLARVPKQWMVNIKDVGRGEKAVKYLSRYLYRGVISQNKISQEPDGKISFRYQDSKTRTMKTKTQEAASFLWKLMQHVLPRGFRRVRDYGFLHPNAKRQLQRVQLILRVKIETKNTEKKAILCQVCKKAVTVVLVNAKKIPMMFRDVLAKHPIATASPS
jgi:hypothetical protein